MRKFSVRTASSAFGFSFVAALAVLPGTAHAGFLDQLFGGFAPQAPQPYTYEQPQAPLDAPFAPQLPPPAHRQHKRTAMIDSKPVRQKTTDLMHDVSLRPGDAVMMKDGIHVYEGDDAAKHTRQDFVSLDQADVTRKQRAELVAMDTTRNDPLRKGLEPDTIASGRSASVASPIVKGFKITDARGKSVRYVGP